MPFRNRQFIVNPDYLLIRAYANIAIFDAENLRVFLLNPIQALYL